MNITKTLLCFASVTVFGYARSPDLETDVIELPPVVVEASRLPDPYLVMRAKLDETRARLVAPARIGIKISPRSSLLSASASSDSPTMKLWFIKQAPRSHRLL